MARKLKFAVNSGVKLLKGKPFKRFDFGKFSKTKVPTTKKVAIIKRVIKEKKA